MSQLLSLSNKIIELLVLPNHSCKIVVVVIINDIFDVIKFIHIRRVNA